jgi:hypothetical protein
LSDRSESLPTNASVTDGEGESTRRKESDGRDIDSKVQVLDFFFEKENIKSMRSFAAGKVADGRVKELVAEAKQFAGEK